MGSYFTGDTPFLWKYIFLMGLYFKGNTLFFSNTIEIKKSGNAKCDAPLYGNTNDRVKVGKYDFYIKPIVMGITQQMFNQQNNITVLLFSSIILVYLSSLLFSLISPPSFSSRIHPGFSSYPSLYYLLSLS